MLVDLELVRAAPPRSVRAGIGETLSNFCAIEDWQLAHERTGEAVDGLAMMLARSAAEAVLYQRGTIDQDAFLHTLAESLVLSGQAMVIAGTSRPCSGACHEISHAIDLLFPDRNGYHGEQVGLGAAFAHVPAQGRGAPRAARRGAALARPAGRAPTTWVSRVDEFTRVVLAAPQTRPGRHTILEELALSDEGTLPRGEGLHRRGVRSCMGVSAAMTATSTPTLEELRSVVQPEELMGRVNGEHWAGRLYMRHVSLRVTRLLVPTRRQRRRRHLGDDRLRRAGRASCSPCRTRSRR